MCSRIAIYSTRATDIDDVSRFAVFYSEIGSCGSDEFEGCGIVEGNYRIPLFVCHLLGCQRLLYQRQASSPDSLRRLSDCPPMIDSGTTNIPYVSRHPT